MNNKNRLLHLIFFANLGLVLMCQYLLNVSMSYAEVKQMLHMFGFAVACGFRIRLIRNYCWL